MKIPAPQAKNLARVMLATSRIKILDFARDDKAATFSVALFSLQIYRSKESCTGINIGILLLLYLENYANIIGVTLQIDYSETPIQQVGP